MLIKRLVLICLILQSIFLSSCSDEEPVKEKVKISVSTSGSYYEYKELLEVFISLDEPIDVGVYVDFKVEGTAIVAVEGNSYSADCYVPEITGSYDPESGIFSGTGKAFIPAGYLGLKVPIFIYQDIFLEGKETLTISLTKVDDPVEIGSKSEAIIDILDESSGMIVELTWNHEENHQVDFDLISWIGNGQPDPVWKSNYFLLGGSLTDNYTGPERLFIPLHAPDNHYAFSIVLNSANFDLLETVNFKVSLKLMRLGTLLSTTELFGTYTDANLNPWSFFDDLQSAELILKKDNLEFSHSGINIPAIGSRVPSHNAGKNRRKPESFSLQIQPIRQLPEIAPVL